MFWYLIKPWMSLQIVVADRPWYFSKYFSNDSVVVAGKPNDSWYSSFLSSAKATGKSLYYLCFWYFLPNKWEKPLILTIPALPLFSGNINLVPSRFPKTMPVWKKIWEAEADANSEKKRYIHWKRGDFCGRNPLNPPYQGDFKRKYLYSEYLSNSR